MSETRRVGVGDVAPDFTLPSQSGEPVRLHELLTRRAVVLYFYPRDETRGCTAEACAFRDRYEVFQEAGAEVVGVSSDSVASHEGFAANHDLPFTLMSDQGGAVRRQYGVKSTLGILPGRVTYVIDREGVVRQVFSSQMDAERHVLEALNTLEEIASRT
jgi:peroxiredoxin Q/BCP